jgi:hypothetical protein
MAVGAIARGEGLAELRGKVTNGAGHPLEHATVLIYHAGAKKGYSTFWPTCDRDCGKRAITDINGLFDIKGVNPALWFDLVVLGDGYQPMLVQGVNPSGGPEAATVLQPRTSANDADRVVRGRVVDPEGNPVPNAVVQSMGVLVKTEEGMTYSFGSVPGLDPIAVTNEAGEFEIAYTKPALRMQLKVEAPAMAPKIFDNVPTGLEYQDMVVSHGAIVRGRLVQGGKPVPNAEVGLTVRNRDYGLGSRVNGANPYGEMRVGTRPDGSFLIRDVPVSVEWYLYGKMDSLAGRGSTAIVECATKRDGEDIDVGDIQVKSGYRLRGRVVLSGGKPTEQDMHVLLTSVRSQDRQSAALNSVGSFEFDNLATGRYAVAPSVRGYHVPVYELPPEIFIDHDIDDFVVKLEPKQ